MRTVEGPALVLEGHVQDTKVNVRGRYRQTRSNLLRNYADAGQIDEAMHSSAEWYEERFKTIFSSGRDSTDIDGKIGSPGTTTPLSQLQADYLRQIVAVDSRLSFENRLIVRGICGEGRHASECVATVTGQFSPHFPIPRFREALTKLGAAIVDARNDHWTVYLKRVQ